MEPARRTGLEEQNPPAEVQEEQTEKETEILFLEEKNKYRKAFGRGIKALKREGITENRNPLFGLPQA